MSKSIAKVIMAAALLTAPFLSYANAKEAPATMTQRIALSSYPDDVIIEIPRQGRDSAQYLAPIGDAGSGYGSGYFERIYRLAA
jgi:hypothetical protein